MRNRYLFLLMLAAALVLLPGCAQVLAAIPSEDGTIEIVLSDYHFQPDTIRVKAGQTVTMLLRNEGDKMHEFMLGRDVRVEGNFTEGFAVDFFAGISPEVTGPGMVMGLPGMEMDMGEAADHTDDSSMDMSTESSAMPMAEPTGEASMNMDTDSEGMDMPMPQPTVESSMDMDAENTAMPMPTEGASMDGESMDMPMNEDTDHADEDEHVEIAQGKFGALQMPEMDAHAGFMVMIDPTMIAPGEVTAITFTVPEDKVGTWTFGCFQERGQHFDDGMRGTFIVEGA